MIPGSVRVPVSALIRGKAQLPPPETPVLLVCAVGGRSYGLGQFLVKKKGYREVYNLEGGVEAWKQQGLPLASGR